MSPWLVLLIAIVGFGLFWLGWLLWLARNNKKIVANKIYVTLLYKSGDRKEVLLAYDAGTVDVPKGFKGNPGGEEAEGSIMLSPDNTFNMLYPPGPGWPPMFVRATVRSTVVGEGHGKGWEPFNTEFQGATDEEINTIKKQSFTLAAIHKRYE